MPGPHHDTAMNLLKTAPAGSALAPALVTAGPAWSPSPATQFSIVGLYGFLEGSDRYGALLGLSKKFGFFGAKPR